MFAKFPPTLCAAVLAIGLTSCGGGAASPSGPSGAVTDTLTITVPRASTSARARSPKYVSPASQSAEVDVVYGSSVTVGATVDFVAGNGACVSTASGLQCTLGVLVQPSATDFIVKLYDQLGEQGNLLSTATVPVPPSPNGTPVNVPVTLNGVVEQIGLAVTGGAFASGAAGTRTLVVTAMDADGNPIVGTLDQPIALASQNPAIALSATSLTGSGSVTLTYNGTGSPTIQIQATDPDGGTHSLTLAPGSGLSLTPNALTFSYVGQTQSVTVSDPSYSGAYTVSGCAGIATYGAVSGGALNVTASAAGSCTIAVVDGNGNQAALSISVSSLNVPID